MFEVSGNGVTLDSKINYETALGIYKGSGSPRKRLYKYLENGNKVVVLSSEAV